MRKAVAMTTTMAIRGGLKSTGSFADCKEAGGGKLTAVEEEEEGVGEGEGEGEGAVGMEGAAMADGVSFGAERREREEKEKRV